LASRPDSLLHQEDREEHDTFREGGAQNRLDENLRRRAGITADGFRSLHTNETYTECRAKGGQTNMNATSHFITFRFLIASRD